MFSDLTLAGDISSFVTDDFRMSMANISGAAEQVSITFSAARCTSQSSFLSLRSHWAL